MKNKNNEIQNKIKEPENSKIDKLKLIKKAINDSLNYNQQNISSELIDNLIEKISVYGNRFIWKLKLDDNESNEEPVLLTSIIIIKEKIKRLASQLNKNIKSCDNIFVDIYI